MKVTGLCVCLPAGMLALIGFIRTLAW